MASKTKNYYLHDLEVIILIPAASHSAANRSSEGWSQGLMAWHPHTPGEHPPTQLKEPQVYLIHSPGPCHRGVFWSPQQLQKAASGKKKEKRSKSEKQTKSWNWLIWRRVLLCSGSDLKITFSLCVLLATNETYLQILSHNPNTFTSSAHSLIIISARAVYFEVHLSATAAAAGQLEIHCGYLAVPCPRWWHLIDITRMRERKDQEVCLLRACVSVCHLDYWSPDVYRLS